MVKLIIFLCILFCYFIRYIILFNKENTAFLFISFLLTTFAFGMTFLNIPLRPEDRSGAFNMTLSIEPFMLLWGLLLLVFLMKYKLRKKNHINKSIYILFFLFLISISNPENYAVISTLTTFLRLLLLLILFYITII